MPTLRERPGNSRPALVDSFNNPSQALAVARWAVLRLLRKRWNDLHRRSELAAAYDRLQNGLKASQPAALDEASIEDTRRLVEGNEFLWIDPPTPEPSNVRLSKALYFIPGDQRPINKWRVEFLQAMDVVAPNVWEELHQLARPILERLMLLRQREVIPPCQLRRAILERRLRRMVLEWSTSHNLGNTWAPMYAWQRLSRSAAAWKQGVIASQAPNPDLPILAQLQPPCWDPFSETEADFQKRTNEYVETIKQHLSKAGARVFPQPGRRDFQRLVRWHVFQESPEAIARGELRASLVHHSKRADALKPRAANIRHVVTYLAKYLDLPKRPANKRGRPREKPV